MSLWRAVEFVIAALNETVLLTSWELKASAGDRGRKGHQCCIPTQTTFSSLSPSSLFFWGVCASCFGNCTFLGEAALQFKSSRQLSDLSLPLSPPLAFPSSIDSARDRAGDSVPLWCILGNKSYSCLHVEAHGRTMAQFSPRQIYPENGQKWARKEVDRDAPEGMCLLQVGFLPLYKHSSVLFTLQKGLKAQCVIFTGIYSLLGMYVNTVGKDR